jgi:hypothetical protein
MDKALQDFIDRQAITELAYAYCRSMDRCDHQIGYSIWHEGSIADYGPIFKGSGPELIDHFLMRHLEFCVEHSHQVTAITINIDGDHAASEAYVYAVVRTRKDGKLRARHVWGRYVDALERRNGRWGIVHRTYIHDFDEIREVEPMAEGWGKRDHSDPSYAILESCGRVAVEA